MDISCDDVLTTFLGFEWESLPFGSTIVDVGGGTGSVALEIAKAHPTFKFVIQDRESVLKSAREVCVNPQAIRV